MRLFLLCLLAAVFPASRATAATAATIAGELSPRARVMLTASLDFTDRLWDESAGLIWSPESGEKRRHLVRESAWYAMGLLMRDRPGDATRAARLIDTVISCQFAAPGQPWAGTFRRSPEEPSPGPGAILWKNYDPNWRQFIGTTFALILAEFEPRLPAGLAGRMTDAIRRAVEGELIQGRAEAYHTNIALLHGFIWSWAGQRLGRADWIAGGDAWMEKIHAAYALHETFEEYNSPTYYGVDLYGLALCRRLGATDNIRTLGARMEAGLWRDIARFYHADLRNLCGPYDRAYGMDMHRYVSLVGVWLGLALEPDLTPLPDPAGPMDHAHDFAFAPLYAALGVQIPADALPAFQSFSGERTLTRVITRERTSTAWLGRDLMMGGEVTGRTFAATPATNQFHPATLHWRIGAHDLGWIALRECPPVDARAEPRALTITTDSGDSTFRVHAPGLTAAMLAHNTWTLPALSVSVATDATHCTVAPIGPDEFAITYRAATRFSLRTIVPRSP